MEHEWRFRQVTFTPGVGRLDNGFLASRFCRDRTDSLDTPPKIHLGDGTDGHVVRDDELDVSDGHDVV
jgi:hypothetical protein